MVTMKPQAYPFVIAALALYSFRSSRLVYGAISIQTEVQCMLEEPSVCIGEQTELGPTPAIECPDLADPTSCRTSYIGGYTYQYSFVEGLPEGTVDVEAIEKAKTGSTVTVYIEDDKESCEVAVGSRSCNRCSTEGCFSSSSGFPNSVKYDCTNLSNGKASMDECEPLEPFLYPFYFAAGPSGVVSDRMEVQAASKYANRGQIPLGFVALGMLIFVLVVGFLSK